MQVVIKKKAVLPHDRVERAFPGMPERWMPDVMNQRERLHQVNTESKLCCDCAGDLRNFERVGQAIAKVIGITAGEYLRLGLKPSERPGVNDSVAITLEVIAVGMGLLRVAASTRVLHRVACEHELSVADGTVLCHSEPGGIQKKTTANPAVVRSRVLFLTLRANCYFASVCSFANRTFADSSFFWTLASASWSTSGPTVLLHSATARSQCDAASLRRPVF